MREWVLEMEFHLHMVELTARIYDYYDAFLAIWASWLLFKDSVRYTEIMK